MIDPPTGIGRMLDEIYTAMDGSEVAGAYADRHGIESQAILTVHEDQTAALIAERLAPRIEGKTVVEIGGGKIHPLLATAGCTLLCVVEIHFRKLDWSVAECARSTVALPNEESKVVIPLQRLHAREGIIAEPAVRAALSVPRKGHLLRCSSRQAIEMRRSDGLPHDCEPCSQFRSVPTGTPTAAANSTWVIPSFRRADRINPARGSVFGLDTT